MALYKYLPSQFLEAFLDGNVRFQPLAYYQRHEEQGAIGDPNEAMRLFRPKTGLPIHNLTTGQRFILPATFVSEIVANDVFVLCLSERLDADLARDLGYDACIEIRDARRFVLRMQTALRGLPGSNVLLKRSVAYYDTEDPVGVNWALPDAIVMSKRAYFAGQHEYRIAFADRRVLRIGNSVQRLQFGEVRPLGHQPIAEPRTVPIGDIRAIATAHRWPAAEQTEAADL